MKTQVLGSTQNPDKVKFKQLRNLEIEAKRITRKYTDHLYTLDAEMIQAQEQKNTRKIVEIYTQKELLTRNSMLELVKGSFFLVYASQNLQAFFLDLLNSQSLAV